MVIELKGKWKKGYAIDIHIISSTYVGEDDKSREKIDK